MYQLVVEGGYIVANGTPADGDTGYFEPGDRIEVVRYEDVPPEHIFAGWQSNNGGAFDFVAAMSTTFTMPANDVTITAEYTIEEPPIIDPPTYNLIVASGTGMIINDTGPSIWPNSICAGEIISLTADSPVSNYVFVRWITELTGEKEE
jgi:hypothetical protein